MPARIFGLRLSLFYTFLFLGAGVQLPFLPLWLQYKGLDADEIAAVVAAMIAVRIVAAPCGAFLADRHGNRRDVVIWSAGLCVAGYAVLPFMDGFWPILLAGIAAQACYSPIVPLAESVAVEGSLHHKLDYGRMRLWGSLSFIFASLLAGALLDVLPVASVVYMILAGQGLLAFACIMLPREPPGAPHRADGGRLRLSDALKLFALPGFIVFIAAASLGQSSHGFLYTFGSVHWNALGYSKPVIGLLWGLSIATEVLLFFFSSRAVKRFGPVNLIVIGTVGAVVRWLVMAGDPLLAVLMMCQALHGLSFSATHLGTMHYIQRNVPAGLRNTAQGLFSATSGGLAMGTVMLASGPLYREFGGQAYLFMVALAGAGLALALLLRRASPKVQAARAS